MSDFLSLLSALTGGYMRGNQMLQNRKIKEAQIARENARDAALAEDRIENRKLRAQQLGVSERQLDETLKTNRQNYERQRATDFKQDVDSAFEPVTQFNKALLDKKFKDRAEALGARKTVQSDLYANLMGLRDRYGLNNFSGFFDGQTFPAYILSKARGLRDFLPSNFEKMGAEGYQPEFASEDQFIYDPTKPISIADRLALEREAAAGLRDASQYPPGPEQQAVISARAGFLGPVFEAAGVPLPELFTKRQMGVMPKVSIPTSIPESIFSESHVPEKAGGLAGQVLGLSKPPEPSYVEGFPSLPQDPKSRSLILNREANTRRINQHIEEAEKLFPAKKTILENKARLSIAAVNAFNEKTNAEIDLKRALAAQAFANAQTAGPRAAAMITTANANVVKAFGGLEDSYSKFLSAAHDQITKIDASLALNPDVKSQGLSQLADILLKKPQDRTADEKQLIISKSAVITDHKNTIEQIKSKRNLQQMINEALQQRTKYRKIKEDQATMRFGSDFGRTFDTPQGLFGYSDFESDELFPRDSSTGTDGLFNVLDFEFGTSPGAKPGLGYVPPYIGTRPSIGGSSQQYR